MTMTRKEFLKMIFAGAAGAAGAAAVPGVAGANIHIEPNHNTMAVLIDLSRCIGCRSCEAACNEQNHLGARSEDFENQDVFETTRRTGSTQFTVVNRFAADSGPVFVKRQCMQCNEPACVSVCPAHAFDKSENGPVVYNPDVCIGCRYCMQACPFSVPGYEYESATQPRVRKCEMCKERLAQGQVPACAEICPQEAIVFGKREVLIAEARKRLDLDPGYVQHVFGENELGGLGVLYISKVPFAELGFPTDLGDEPLPRLTYGYLSTIPVLHITLPILMAGFYLVTRRRDDSAHRSEADHDE